VSSAMAQMASVIDPSRGEIWQVNLNPTQGHEQSGTRPALVVSEDTFNKGPAGLVIVIPITSVGKGISFHVEVKPPEGGLTMRSFIKCEEIRCVSKQRLSQRLGEVSERTIESVEDRLKIVLDLHP
jgi:mRNA interferase MazF